MLISLGLVITGAILLLYLYERLPAALQSGLRGQTKARVYKPRPRRSK
jgi:hypothetical protein